MPDYKAEVLAALGKELRDCGIYAPAEYKKLSLALLRKPKQITAPFDIFIKFVLSTVFGASFRIILQAKPIRTQKERDAMIRRIEGAGQRLRPQVVGMMNQIREAFPQKKHGPKSRLTSQQKLVALGTIDTLRKNGTTAKHAIAIVARDCGVTERLMRKYHEQKI